jgi:hypothetical protein
MAQEPKPISGQVKPCRPKDRKCLKGKMIDTIEYNPVRVEKAGRFQLSHCDAGRRE